MQQVSTLKEESTVFNLLDDLFVELDQALQHRVHDVTPQLLFNFDETPFEAQKHALEVGKAVLGFCCRDYQTTTLHEVSREVQMWFEVRDFDFFATPLHHAAAHNYALEEV